VIQAGGARRPVGQLFRRRNRYPVLFVIVREKDKTAGIKNDLGAQDDAIPFNPRVQVRLRAQYDVREVGQFPDFPERRISYCHTFYGLADGGALAFFGFAEPDVYEAFKAKDSIIWRWR